VKRLSERLDADESEEVRRSPRILERYCHNLYEVENRELIAELGWDTDAFIQGRRANWKSEISQPSTTFGPRAPPPWSKPFSTARLARWLTTRGCRRRRPARLMAPGRRHGSQAASPPHTPYATAMSRCGTAPSSTSAGTSVRCYLHVCFTVSGESPRPPRRQRGEVSRPGAVSYRARMAVHDVVEYVRERT